MRRALLILLALGCSETSSDPAGTGGSGGSAGLATGGGAGANGAPVIGEVLVTGALDDDTKSVTLTVDVTDPDGFDDIAGGKLYTQGKSKFLGAFDQVSAGTFTQAVSWQALNEPERVILAKGEKTTRTVLIEFTDSSMNVGSLEKVLQVDCSACGAECKACGQCTLGKCTMCEPSLKWSNCNLFCTSFGMVCSCSYSECGGPLCAVNGCSDPCPATGCACDCI